MTTRRGFLQAGAVLGAVAAPGAAALAATPKQSRTLVLHRVAFDGRTQAGLAFGAEARRLGATVYDTGGDVSRFYADELLPRWSRSPAPVAGLTSHASMFVLQMMATSAELRLIWRAHHLETADGKATHALFGPEAVRAEAALDTAGADWASRAARIVTRWPAAEATVAGDRSNIADAERTGVAPDTLVSWVLAPVRRA